MKYAIFALLCTVMLTGAGRAANRIQVHGHRGARAIYPENTLPAFEYAIEQGVDVLELDLSVTRDGFLVVSHDPVLRAPICTGPRDEAVIHELTLAEVREWDCGAVQNPRFATQQTVAGTRMPTLDQVFALAGRGSFRFNIETKSFPDMPELTPPPEEFARLVWERIQAHDLAGRVLVQSFDFRTLDAMRALAPEIELAALYQGPPRDFVEIAQEAGAGIVSPMYQLVTPGQVAAAHAAGLQVVPWTPDAPEAWDALVAAGVDAIITDDPAGLIAHLK